MQLTATVHLGQDTSRADAAFEVPLISP